MTEEFLKYPHLVNLYKADHILLEDEVVALEKADGTNMRFGLVDGYFVVGTRNNTITRVRRDDQMLTADNDFGLLHWLRTNEIRETLYANLSDKSDTIFYGEWYGKGIQKRVNYGEEKHFRVFGVRVDGDFLSWDDTKAYAEGVGLATMPEVYRGKPDVPTLEALLDKQSEVAKLNGVPDDPENISEGIVLQSLPMKRDEFGEWLIVKFKSAKFEERASKSRKTSAQAPVLDPGVEGFVTEFVTAGRLVHVLDQLTENGVDVRDIRSMGQVLKAMSLDVQREGKEEFESLGVEWKPVSRHVTNQTSILYKQHLVQGLKT